MMDQLYDVIIVGGGLAGLIAAIELSRAKNRVLLIEKKTYPFHKVCGEYVSNEVLPYLQSLGFDPFRHGAAKITSLRVSTPSGKNVRTPLDLGGFGISRYCMEDMLHQLAINNGADVLTNTRVTDIQFAEDVFSVVTNTSQTFKAKLVIGSYGKRDVLDKKLNRPFINQHTGYLGVKYHIKTDYPLDEVGLDNFPGGYCGIAKIEDDKYNLCYLYKIPVVKKHSSIPDLEQNILCQNPVLKSIFSNSEFLYDAPEVINEICFAPKELVKDHILMCGDSAGLITPLCGNGMSMAIAGGRLLSRLIIRTGIVENNILPMRARLQLEASYVKEWNRSFRQRLFWGRTIQRFFGNPLLTAAFVKGIHSIPRLEKKLLSYTHGKTLST